MLFSLILSLRSKCLVSCLSVVNKNVGTCSACTHAQHWLWSKTHVILKQYTKKCLCYLVLSTLFIKSKRHTGINTFGWFHRLQLSIILDFVILGKTVQQYLEADAITISLGKWLVSCSYNALDCRVPMNFKTHVNISNSITPYNCAKYTFYAVVCLQIAQQEFSVRDISLYDCTDLYNCLKYVLL